MKPRHVRVVVIGGGQAGLSVSYHLKQAHVEHVVLEKSRVAESWRSERWDSFCLVTPNWQCRLPGFPYTGPEPDGFMKKQEVVEYVESFARSFEPPLCLGVEVYAVRRQALLGCYEVVTSEGEYTADAVVVAVGCFHRPRIPAFARLVPPGIRQLNSSEYRSPGDLPPGEIVVVGSGQSGCQIAEDLHLAGRQVHLCLGDAPRSPRLYRGKDVVWWLDHFGYYDTPIDAHPDVEMVRNKTNHYLTGRDGGREIDLRQFAREGMQLYGFLKGLEQGALQFVPDLRERLDAADAVYNGICKLIDQYIEKSGVQAPPPSRYEPCWVPEREPTELSLSDGKVTALIWSIGFRSDFAFLKLPVLNAHGYPQHQRGVTTAPGLYFIGLSWLHTWGSARLSGVAKDAEYLAGHLIRNLELSPAHDAKRSAARARL